MQNLRIQQGRTLPSAGRWLRVHGTLCSGHTHPALGGDATDTRQTRTSRGAAAACLAVSLTGGEGRRPERPAAVAEPQVAMEPGVLPQIPHDNRAVRGPRKQQEGLAGAQAAARDLGGTRSSPSPRRPHQPPGGRPVSVRWRPPTACTPTPLPVFPSTTRVAESYLHDPETDSRLLSSTASVAISASEVREDANRKTRACVPTGSPRHRAALPPACWSPDRGLRPAVGSASGHRAATSSTQRNLPNPRPTERGGVCCWGPGPSRDDVSIRLEPGSRGTKRLWRPGSPHVHTQTFCFLRVPVLLRPCPPTPWPTPPALALADPTTPPSCTSDSQTRTF